MDCDGDSDPGKGEHPRAVCGGLPVGGILAVLYFSDIQPIKFDTALQVPLQNTFFASIGFAASLALLRNEADRSSSCSSSSRSSSPRCRTSSVSRWRGGSDNTR